MKVYTKAGKEYKGAHIRCLTVRFILARNILKIVNDYIKRNLKSNGY